MKFRVFSDIHNEFFNYEEMFYKIEEMEEDKDSTLILAGDICLLSDFSFFKPFFDRVSKQFKNVFYIGGNHEWYHGDISTMKVEDVASQYDNIFTKELILEEEKIVIIGDTLWSDFQEENPLVMEESRLRMNDFYLIKKDKQKFLPFDAFSLHTKMKSRIFEQVDRYSEKGYKVVVVTHHQPSYQSIIPMHKGDILNGAYCSDLDEEIKTHKIDYWIAGHVHTAMDYNIGETKVIVNPVGYPTQETGYDKFKSFEIK